MRNGTNNPSVQARELVLAVVRQLRGLVVQPVEDRQTEHQDEYGVLAIQPVQYRQTEHREDRALIEYLAAIALKLWAAPFLSFLIRTARSAQLRDTCADFELELQLLYWQFHVLQSRDWNLEAKLQRLARLLVCCRAPAFVAVASPAVELTQIHSQQERTFGVIAARLACLFHFFGLYRLMLICFVHRNGKVLRLTSP